MRHTESMRVRALAAALVMAIILWPSLSVYAVTSRETAFSVASLSAADATIPTADRKGSKDHPLLKRYEGSFIVAYEHQSFAELTLPLSPLVQVPERKNQKNSRVHEPNEKKALEGSYTRIAYLIPENRSPLEVVRNYEDEIAAKGGRVLFTCRGEACGGDPKRSSGGGGGDMSLAMFLYPVDRITDAFGSNGYCAQAEQIADQRYAVAELPDAGAHVSVLTYTLVAPGIHDSCRAFNARTITVVDIIEAKARETKMVTVAAADMAKAIASAGRVALYGIYFDFNKSDVKPESDPTLQQIATLLKGNTSMTLLVVGHTDNVGGFDFNMDLSQRRAAAVVAALAARYGVSKERLASVGVSFASPIASNQSEEGRARNRRVELVERAASPR